MRMQGSRRVWPPGMGLQRNPGLLVPLPPLKRNDGWTFTTGEVCVGASLRFGCVSPIYRHTETHQIPTARNAHALITRNA